MYSAEKSMTFSQLLDYCSNIASVNWERGWGEFINRYKIFIYNNVIKSCNTWNVPRLRQQFSDAVNDVFSEIIVLLCKNECRALREFRARDNERMFLSWLATICNRTTGRYIQHYFTSTFIEGEIEDVKEYTASLAFDIRWELYEYIITKLRSSAGRKKRHLERDIHIFMLYVWTDFTAQMITTHPCLNTIGHRVVDNVVNRMRNFLRDNTP
jgi:hypothetical protein